MSNQQTDKVHIDDCQVGDPGKPWLGFDGTNVTINVPSGGVIQSSYGGGTPNTILDTSSGGATGASVTGSLSILGSSGTPAAIAASGTGSGGLELSATSALGRIYLSPRGVSKAHQFNATINAPTQLQYSVTNSGSTTSASITVLDGATLNSGLVLQASGTNANSTVSVANSTYTSTLIDQNANLTAYGGVFSDSLNGNVGAHNGGWFANADTAGGGQPNVTLAADGSTGTAALKYRHSTLNWTIASESGTTTTLCDTSANMTLGGSTFQIAANGTIGAWGAGTLTIGNANVTQLNLSPNVAGKVNFAYAVTAAGTGAAPTLPANTPTGATGGTLKYLPVLINGTSSWILAAQ